MAAGLAVVFFAGRVSADPVASPSVLDDTSPAVEKVASELSEIKSEIRSIRSNGVELKGTYNSSAYPLYVKVQQ